eukprot:Tamp_17303.p1 GENE.Tamp_17303~~Tamp_17303.p1  ORF type:complete len:126 (+),score=8.87 Tamp_17303:900-1277(+)
MQQGASACCSDCSTIHHCSDAHCSDALPPLVCPGQLAQTCDALHTDAQTQDVVHTMQQAQRMMQLSAVTRASQSVACIPRFWLSSSESSWEVPPSAKACPDPIPFHSGHATREPSRQWTDEQRQT